MNNLITVLISGMLAKKVPSPYNCPEDFYVVLGERALLERGYCQQVLQINDFIKVR